MRAKNKFLIATGLGLVTSSLMELPLRFHREILRQLIPGTPDTATPDPSDTSTQDLDPCESGLLILARGLGLRRVVCSFLTLQSDPRRLVLLLNADSPEEDGIGDLLGTMGVAKPGLRVVNFDMISKQREELYKEGGLVSVTSRILVVDMLNGTIPVHLISGMVILHAEQWVLCWTVWNYHSTLPESHQPRSRPSLLEFTASITR